MWIGDVQHDGHFYQFSKHIQKQILPGANPEYLYINMFYLEESGVSHKREVYTSIEALGDIGGILEIIFILFGTIFLPISRHSFYLHASRFMFFARSRDSNLFVKGNKQEEQEENLAKYIPKD